MSRVYQFSKRHALEECRQQVALSQGMRAKLEAQRVILKDKLDLLGSKEPPSALTLDPDTVSLSSSSSNVFSLCQRLSFLCLFLAPNQSSSVNQPEVKKNRLCVAFKLKKQAMV